MERMRKYITLPNSPVPQRVDGNGVSPGAAPGASGSAAAGAARSAVPVGGTLQLRISQLSAHRWKQHVHVTAQLWYSATVMWRLRQVLPLFVPKHSG